MKPHKDGKNPKTEALKILVLFLSAVTISVWHLAKTANVKMPKDLKGVGHAGEKAKEKRRKRDEARATLKEEKEILSNRDRNVDCDFFTAQSLIPHGYAEKPIMGTYATFDMKEGGTISLKSGSVYIMPHHNLVNIRSMDDQPCAENNFVAMGAIKAGSELYVDFNDRCVSYQADTPRLDDYIRAGEIINDAFKVGRQMNQKKGARMNLGIINGTWGFLKLLTKSFPFLIVI